MAEMLDATVSAQCSVHLPCYNQAFPFITKLQHCYHLHASTKKAYSSSDLSRSNDVYALGGLPWVRV